MTDFQFPFRGALLCGMLALILVAAAVPAAAAAEGNYMVMYIVGSDLESGQYQAASNNLRDLVNSWDPAMGDILIIYGGAQKTGWNDGVAITNLELLTKDFDDGIIGSDQDSDGAPTRYVLKRMPGVDISTPQTLGAALQYAEQYRKSTGLANARNVLLFWNHGGGYSGYGQNELTGRMLSLDDISAGLSRTKTTYDLIAFDACLMGSLEVADALSPYGTYLLASEESVPGCGFDYKAFAQLSASPGMSTQTLGENIISYYIDQSATKKTLSLVRLSQVSQVIAAVNEFGRELEEIVDNPDSLASLGSIYQNTQGFGVCSGNPTPIAMDLYEFVYMVYEQTNENSDLHAAAYNLLIAIERYVLVTQHDGYFSAATGVSVASPHENFLSEIPDTISLGRSGWYSYMSTYMNYAGISAQPHAAYTTAAAADARSIQVTDSTGTAWVTANYLYLNNDGTYSILGDVPLKESMKPANNSVWTTVPTGLYDDPDWDANWFVFQNSDGTTVPATLTYTGPAVIGNRSHVIYTIEGNLTRMVNGTSITAASVLTAVIDDKNQSVSALSVTEKYDNIWDARSNIWGNTTILSGDIFVPALQIYDEEQDTIFVTVSPQSVTFGSNPKESLRYTALDEDNCYWMVELDDYLDDDVFYLEEPGMDTATPKPTQSSPAAAGIFAGVLIAGLLLKRK